MSGDYNSILLAHVEYIRGKVDVIEAQVAAQNGRVRKLEVAQGKIEGSIATIKAIIPVVGIAATITGFVLNYLGVLQ